MSAGFLLDTNVPSETLRPMPHPKVTAWVEAQSERWGVMDAGRQGSRLASRTA